MTESLVRSEARILLAAARSLARRPLERVDVEPGWRRFGALEASSYGNIVSMLLLLIVLEAPAVHLVLGALLEDGALRGAIRAVLLGSSVYVALWLIGDLRLLRETPGVLVGEQRLVIELGLRVHGTVLLSTVTAAQRLGADHATESEGARVIRITPLPQPNCRIRLSAAVSMRGIFGVPLRGDILDIYVDDPAGLVSSIEAAPARCAS